MGRVDCGQGHIVLMASASHLGFVDSQLHIWLLIQIIGGDPDKDIAVLQLQAPEEKLAELKPVSIGSSTNLQVGQKVHSFVTDMPFGPTALWCAVANVLSLLLSVHGRAHTWGLSCCC